MKYLFAYTKKIFFSLAICMAVFSAYHVSAQTFTVFETLDTPDHGVGDAVGANSQNVYGIRFITPDQSISVNSVQIQDLYVNPILTGFDIDIYNTGSSKLSDVAPVGSIVVGSFSSTPSNNSDGILTFQPTSAITLEPNTSYWLIMKTTSPGDFISLKISDITPTGTALIPEEGYRAYSSNGGTNYVYDSSVNAGGSLGTGPWLPHVALIANQIFSGEGAGTSIDPYIITTCDELQEMNYDLDAYYVLGNDIDCVETQEWNVNTDEWVDGVVGGDLIPDEYTGVINNGYFGFDPIGRTGFESGGFTGTLDGQNFSISNLWIFRKNQEFTGLIGYATGATIENLTLVNSEIVGDSNTGAFIGNGSSVSLDNLTNQNGMVRAYLSYYGGGIAGQISDTSNLSDLSVVNGTVHGSGNIIGGLIGRMSDSTISDSISSADVDGGEFIGGAFGILNSSDATSVVSEGNVVSNESEEAYLPGIIKSGNYTGGFAGQINASEIFESRAIGDVSAEGNYVGGFAGEISDSTIGSVSSRGLVSGDISVGGFAGQISGSLLSDVYSGGDVTGSDYIGGFVGEIFTTDIDNAYSRGLVVSDELAEFFGGFAASVGIETNINNSFWDFESSAQENACGEGDCSLISPLSTSQATSQTPYISANWDFESVWRKNAGNDGYPYLQFEPIEDVEPEPEPSPAPRRQTGSFATSRLTVSPQVNTISNENINECPVGQILTQNLRTGARNGKYHSYTGDIVREVHVLQNHLNRLGFNSGPADGILGPISDGAIRRMQAYLGTKVDGFVGPITRSLLNVSCGNAGLQTI